MRGNRLGTPDVHVELRSIPAYAGEPPQWHGSRPSPRVYPRVCGGTRERYKFLYLRKGLSPRMRGNPRHIGAATAGAGSIPAYAGEPLLPLLVFAQQMVYPRVCGGTVAAEQFVYRRLGLSPRMRGNLRSHLGDGLRIGSIPAYAGEPEHDVTHSRCHKVYPRVCGGTSWRPRVSVFFQGLSPRMRGNHRISGIPSSDSGSIPAYAGEPPQYLLSRCPAQVYPRVCGGTPSGSRRRVTAKGLSPRMRGNRGALGEALVHQGSIPAYAGEPR